MKQDFLIFCFKLGLTVAIVAVCLLWGLGRLWYVVVGLFGVGLLLYMCRLWARIKQVAMYTRPLRLFCDALQHADTAAFEKLLQRYMPAFRNGKKDRLCEDVFAAVVQGDSLPAMRLLLQQESALWWQSKLSTADPLCLTVLHGSPQMLRFLIEQGMRPDLEWESPWLIALINARIEHARTLAALNAAIITQEQQERSAWPPLELILSSPDFFPTLTHRDAVTLFLKDIGWKVYENA